MQPAPNAPLATDLGPLPMGSPVVRVQTAALREESWALVDDALNVIEAQPGFAASFGQPGRSLQGLSLWEVMDEPRAASIATLIDGLLTVPRRSGVGLSVSDGSYEATCLASRAGMIAGARPCFRLTPVTRAGTAGAAVPDQGIASLQQLLLGLPVPVAYVDTTHTFRFANQAYAEHLDRSVSDIVDHAVEGVLGNDLSSLILQPLLRALSGEAVSYERLVPTRNLGHRWFQVSLTPDVSGNGQLRGVFVIPRDVHALKLAYQSLREKEEHLRDVIDSIPSPAAYLSNGLQFDYVNLAFARWRGQPRATLLGKSLTTCVEAGFLDAVMDPINRALQGGQGSVEVLLRFPDGAERWVQCHVEPRLVRGNVEGVYLMTSDITEQKIAREKLLFANQIIALHMQHTPLAVIELDRDLAVTRWSEQALRIFGISEREALDHSLSSVEIAHPEDAERLLQELAALSAGEHPYSALTLRNITADRRTIWCEWHVSCLRDRHGEPIHYMALVQDVSERVENECRLQHAVTHDPLTSLPNRSVLNGQLEQITRSADPQRPVFMLFLDLDNFKDINDSLGHASGDALLVEVARHIRALISTTDTLVRAGGDEFVVLGEGEADIAARTARALIDGLKGQVFLGPHRVFVSASIGIAMYPMDGLDESELLKCADAAMYQAKAGGRGTFQFYSEHIGLEAQRRLNLLSALKQALEKRQLVVHLQPIVNLPDQRPAGAELLLRWTDPELGVISPAVFIPLAEDNGLIDEIGDFVIGEAVDLCARWQRENRPMIRISINISPNQLRNPQFADRFIRRVEEAGCDPTWLKLEVTETCAVTDRENTARMLGALRRLGIGVALDDFGTGYSSLSLMQQLPITDIKIDQSFTKRIGTSAESTALVAGIIGLSHGLGLAVVAEGVETEGQLAFLRQHGCGFFQGNLFSPAVSLEAFERLWQSGPAPPATGEPDAGPPLAAPAES